MLSFATSIQLPSPSYHQHYPLCSFSHHFPQTHMQKAPIGGPKNLSSRGTVIPSPAESQCSLAFLAPLEAILFDIDGTLCDSDPLHLDAFVTMLQEVGFNDGIPISEEYFIQHISGKHNDDLHGILFPDWDTERATKFLLDKEEMFRRMASERLEPMKGIDKLTKWIEDKGLKRAAVTNAPRSNGELIVSSLGLSHFFQFLCIGNECERAKPFPDPYLKALQVLGVSPQHTFVFEDSVSGIKAGVAAGMPVVGIAARNPEQLLLEAGALFVIKDFNDPKLWTTLDELENIAGSRNSQINYP